MALRTHNVIDHSKHCNVIDRVPRGYYRRDALTAMPWICVKHATRRRRAVVYDMARHDDSHKLEFADAVDSSLRQDRLITPFEFCVSTLRRAAQMWPLATISEFGYSGTLTPAIDLASNDSHLAAFTLVNRSFCSPAILSAMMVL